MQNKRIIKFCLGFFLSKNDIFERSCPQALDFCSWWMNRSFSCFFSCVWLWWRFCLNIKWPIKFYFKFILSEVMKSQLVLCLYKVSFISFASKNNILTQESRISHRRSKIKLKLCKNRENFFYQQILFDYNDTCQVLR